VTLHADEGPPYTITSAWQDDGQITFIIKALGDYTATLAERVQVGDVVRIEGRTVASTSRPPAPPDLGGRGHWHHPFIARMKALAQQADGREIDLFHTTAVYDPRHRPLSATPARRGRPACAVG
jgi:predicted ferric reductase